MIPCGVARRAGQQAAAPTARSAPAERGERCLTSAASLRAVPALFERSSDEVFASVLDGQPDIRDALDAVAKAAWESVDPVLLELCRLRMAMLFGCPAELAWRTPASVAAGLEEERIEVLAHWPTSQRFGPLERGVPRVRRAVRHRRRRARRCRCGRGRRAPRRTRARRLRQRAVGRRATAASPAHLAAPVRARVVSDGSRSPRVSDGARAVPRLRQALSTWQAAVVRLAAVDPVTTELVRLRCARYHDCRT